MSEALRVIRGASWFRGVATDRSSRYKGTPSYRFHELGFRCVLFENAHSNRVRRGGSWGDVATYCHAAYRYYGDPGYRYGNLGLRLVRRDG